MGVALGDLIIKEKIKLEDLAGRKIAVDAYNTLYQFLSTIRQPDGTPLMDSQGRITSHLTGLLYRTARLLETEIKPVFVFDGKPPELKAETLSHRKTVKQKAKMEWLKALEEEDFELAKKAAQATSKLTAEMVEEAKEVLDAMGVPWVQAPGEGEAQAVHMTKKGDVWATASQDYDALIYGSPILIRYLTLTGKRKLPGKKIYVNVEPEKIILDNSLKNIGITSDQLLDIALLIGTDYHSGIRGVGPKTALKLMKEGKTAEEVYKEKNITPEVDLDELRELFLKPDVTNKYKIEWKQPDRQKMIDVLSKKHDFSQERVEKVYENLTGMEDGQNQSKLDAWVK